MKLFFVALIKKNGGFGGFETPIDIVFCLRDASANTAACYYEGDGEDCEDQGGLGSPFEPITTLSLVTANTASNPTARL